MSGIPRSYSLHSQHKWYYRLVPSSEGRALMNDYPLSTLIDSLIVCWTPKNQKDGSPQRMYGRFNSYLDFYRYYQTAEPKAFYEIVLGEFAQKPHFDLDLQNVTTEYADSVVNRLIEAIGVVFKRFNVHWIPENDLLVYSSHGGTKHSYHIILNNHSHGSNLEAKEFYQLIVAEMPPGDRDFVDPAVYSPRQQFRFLGSSKLGAQRPKVSAMPWNGVVHQYLEEPENDEIRKLMDFEESLISVTHGCRLLPTFLPDHPAEFSVSEHLDITEETAKAAINLLKSKSPNAWPYRPLGIRGGMILLKRVQPSMCRICQRVHHMENPFLTVVTKETEFIVYFNCRRSRQSWMVGSIPIPGAVTPTVISQTWMQDIMFRLRDVAGEPRGPKFKTEK